MAERCSNYDTLILCPLLLMVAALILKNGSVGLERGIVEVAVVVLQLVHQVASACGRIVVAAPEEIGRRPRHWS